MMTKINYEFAKFMIAVLLTASMCLIIIFIGLSMRVSENNEIEGGNSEIIHESVCEKIDHSIIIPSANALPNESETNVEETKYKLFDFEISENDKYLLAKIAMAEAEGESFKTKVLVILTILNRVNSNEFPDTIEEVIFQNRKGIYQFSPVMPNGRWWKVEPNQDCWKAVDEVMLLEYDISEGALYFEACKGESWHSRNLELICKSSNTRFYK